MADGLTAIGIVPEAAGSAEAEAGPDTATVGATDAPDAAPKERKVRAGTKQAMLIEMLRAPECASIEEIVAATNWKSHTVRGAIAVALKKKLALNVTSEKVENRGRVYRIS